MQFIKILIIDDEEKKSKNLMNLIKNESNEKYKYILSLETDFNNAKKLVEKDLYDILILDWKDKDDNFAGKKVLDFVYKYAYTPLIIYSAYPELIKMEETMFGKIVQKGANGFKDLMNGLLEIVESDLYLFKLSLEGDIIFSLRNFWKFFFLNWEILSKKHQEEIIKLMILNRLGYTLSREKFINFKSEHKLNIKGHPQNYYVYPPYSRDEINTLEVTDILLLKNKENEELKKQLYGYENTDFYIILTPTCDLEIRGDGKPKAEKVLIASCISIKSLHFEAPTISGNKKQIKNFFIDEKKRERYFLLPGTTFIPDSFIDFQSLYHVDFDLVNNNDLFEKITSLSYPFAQVLSREFSAYYNRIGFEDINDNIVIKRLDK